MKERQAAETWIYSQLSSIAGNGAWANYAPPGTDTDYIVFNVASAVDELGNMRNRQYTTFQFQVRYTVLDEGNGKAAADQAEEDIDDALENQHVSSNGYQIDCTRTGPLALSSTSLGRNYRYSGGRYRVIVRKEL